MDNRKNQEEGIIVDASGRGDFTTLQDAVFAAEHGSVIFVRNGVYKESVRIDKPLVLKGESLTGVVLSNLSGCVFRIQDAGEVILHNMTLSVNGGTGIRVRSARSRCIVTVEQVRVIGHGILGALCGISIKGKQSRVDIHQCTFNDNISQAVYVSREAAVELYECVFNAVSCIEARDKNTHISATKCIFMPWSEGHTRAVSVYNYAQCKLINNELLGFTKAIHIGSGAVANIVENVFEDNKIWCVYAKGKASRAFILNNRFIKNRPGKRLGDLKSRFRIPKEYDIACCIWMEDGASAEIHHNRFEKNIHCIEGKGEYTKISVSENLFAGNKLFQKYTPELVDLIVQTQAQVDYVMMVREKAEASLENNIFENNGIKQVIVDHLSSDVVFMADNTFMSNFDD